MSDPSLDFAAPGFDVFQDQTVNIPINAAVLSGSYGMFAIVFAGDQNPNGVSVPAWTSYGIDTFPGAGRDKWAFNKFYDASDQANAGTGNWVCSCDDGFIEVWFTSGYSNVNQSSPYAAGPSINVGTTLTFTFPAFGSGAGMWAGILLIADNSSLATDPPGVTKEVTATSPNFSAQAILYDAAATAGFPAKSGTVTSGFQWGLVDMILAGSGAAPGGCSFNPIGIHYVTP